MRVVRRSAKPGSQPILTGPRVAQHGDVIGRHDSRPLCNGGCA